MPKKHDKNRPHWFSPVWCCVSLPPSFSSCPSRCPHRRFPGGSITASCSSLSHRRGSLITPAVKTVKGLQARILYSGSSVRRCCPNVVPVFNSMKTFWDHWDSLAEKQRQGGKKKTKHIFWQYHLRGMTHGEMIFGITAQPRVWCFYTTIKQNVTKP